MIYVIFFTAICPVLMWLLFYFLYNTLKGDTARYQLIWIFGVVVDLYMNLTWGTIVFMQLPNIHRGFLSARMDDLILKGSGWRQKLAVYLVGRFLEPYDLSSPKQHRTYGEFQG